MSYPRITIFGDSLTWGSVASMPNTAWPHLVVQGLQARHADSGAFPLVNGVPGITTAGSIVTLQEQQITPVADLYILELGTNDFGQNVAPATFQAQYVAFCQMLAHANPAAMLIGLTCWRAAGDLNTATPPSPASLYSAIITDAILHQSGAAHSGVADLMPLYAVADNHNMAGDTFHPNDTGHVAIAQAVLAQIP